PPLLVSVFAGRSRDGGERDELVVDQADDFVVDHPPGPGGMSRASAQAERIAIAGAVQPENENRFVLGRGLLAHGPEVGVPTDLSPGVLAAAGTDQVAHALEGVLPELNPGNRT